jgi:A nuclease family of the HNH/ENDO VII superfamily with conserved AHH
LKAGGSEAGGPAMPSFREMGMKCRVEGFHRHHIIPIEVVERPAFSIMFGHLRAIGFDPQDFETNGMYLPCTEKMAMVFEMPMHRGSHRQYNEVVANRVGTIASLPIGDAYMNIRLLQNVLRRGLRRSCTLQPDSASGFQIDFRTLEMEANLLHGLIDTAFRQ